MVNIQPRHKRSAETFRLWLTQHKDSTHGEMFAAFNRIVDKESYEARRKRIEKVEARRVVKRA